MTLRQPCSLLAIPIAALLAACGGNTDHDAPIRTAALVQVAAEPQPDCAPEGCNGLRIIDANAEAYRLEAQRRAEADQAAL